MHLLLSFLCLLGFSHAHTTFTDFFVNGAAQGDGTCVRMSRTPQNATSPLPDIKAPEMACGVNGDMGVARVCSAPAGALMTFEFRERPDGKEPGAIDKSHKGPIAVYMKKVADPTANGTAAGDGWFKIFQQTFDNSAQKWATETLIDNKGLLSVNLPKGLAGGYYLVRTELLALHEADKTPPDPQFYVGCAQIFLQDGGSTDPPNKVKIPGYIDLDNNKAALTFNIYKQPMALPYPMFGPPVFTGGSSTQKAATNATEQTLGLKADDCVLTNANWCGRELATYTTEQGCWNASTACWAQCSDCYNQAPPTGSANCQIWETKCKGIQEQCNAKNFNGPPNRMQDLTPKNKQVQVPPAANAQDNAGYATSSVSAGQYITSQPIASASDAANAAQVTTVYQKSFDTVTRTLPSNSPLPSSSSSSNQAAVATPAAATTTSASAYAAASTPQANIGPDAFGSMDECGARNASSPCGGALCCSQFGYCGATSQHCGIGCQDQFGACDQLPSNSTDAQCTEGAGQASVSSSSASAAAAATTGTADANGNGGGYGEANSTTTAAAATGATGGDTSTATPASSSASAGSSGQAAPSSYASSASQAGASGSNGATSSASSASTSSSTSSASASSRSAFSFSIPGPKPTSDVTVVVLEADNEGKDA